MADSKLPRQAYSPDEVKEILHRALDRESAARDGLSHEDLVEVAAEVGIDRAALDAAAADLATARADRVSRVAKEERLRKARSAAWWRLFSSLLSFLAVGGFLYWLDVRYSGAVWAHWVLLAWGIGLVFQLAAVLVPGRIER